MSIPITLAEFCESNLKLNEAKLSDEYYYQSLPLCVIDAVYSIGAHYSSTKKVVIRFCEKFNLQRIRQSKIKIPDVSEQLSTTSFLKMVSKYSYEDLAKNIFQNRQRTSTKNGILKAEAVVKFAEVLQNHGGEYLQDCNRLIGDLNFKSEIKKIQGQRSGISTRYFYMLAGSDDFIKPDRMIIRFIKDRTGLELSIEQSQTLIVDTQKILAINHPHITPRLLDHMIWNLQSGR